MVDNKKNKFLNSLRILGVEAVNKANSGHPGIILGAAPMVYELYTKHINIDPSNPKWFNRDRFVLSAGHGSGLLYSILHLSGFGVEIDDLKKFRQLNSKTPGHPEFGMTDGVEVTTGPLGQGLAAAVGMAVAEKHLAGKFNKPELEVVNHFTYVLVGDGDLQEGIAQEAISFAGNYGLNKLIVLHDSNDIQLDGPVKIAQSEKMQERFLAANWNTILVKDGEDLAQISKAFESAKKSTKPTYIEVKTIIGLGATKQGTSAVHGEPVKDDLINVKKYYNWTNPEFTIDEEVYAHYKATVGDRGHEAYDQWNKIFNKYKQNYPQEFSQLEAGILKQYQVTEADFQAMIPSKPQATRVSSGQVLDKISSLVPSFIGGSADLTASTKAKGADGNFYQDNLQGRNIMYGVREFGMTAINNGIAAHSGLLPFAGGFFVFSDYMKPAIRLAALMELQSFYVFTHDSVAVGEDGPTHEPVEQLAMLRSIPGLNVFRPADFQETYASYLTALNDKNKPSAFILTRQDLPELAHKDVVKNVGKGAYLISESKNAQVTLIATGSEVSLALKIKDELEKNQKLAVNVVSMVSMNIFDRQEKKYQDTIIQRNTQRFSIEMGTTFGWGKYLGDDGFAFGIDRFGHSAPGDQVIKEFGFTVENLTKKIIDKLK
ncbi:transketolase [Spiroplasma sabaudiense Ar-1343]|uniref:Transketolase n=1 Tax=Spiroplasma sabaudiense Ar-1343 TaxID=1276257 RepID=W6AAN0_9MOLU|nr:transketolase [Spiroplasma sabaudiense]AHI53910.1 transketolase [Spiroplasma sabaudiense Ar-1343]